MPSALKPVILAAAQTMSVWKMIRVRSSKKGHVALSLSNILSKFVVKAFKETK